MARSTPSLIALLGLVAVAGYQNRGKISEMLADAQQKDPAAGGSPAPAHGGFLSHIGELFQTGTSGSTLASGLRDLVDRFSASGRGDAAQSWVSNAPNRPMNAEDFEVALGQDTLEELSQKTGLSRAELVGRLKTALPEVVNRLTPDWRLPSNDDAQNLV